MDLEEYLTYEQIAEQLKLHVVTVRKLAARGAFEVLKLGRSARVPRRSLEAYIERNTRPSRYSGQMGSDGPEDPESTQG